MPALYKVPGVKCLRINLLAASLLFILSNFSVVNAESTGAKTVYTLEPAKFNYVMVFMNAVKK